DGGFRVRYSVCDWGGAGLGDCDIVGSGGGLYARGIFQCASGDVFGDRDDDWCDDGSGDCDLFTRFDHRGDLRLGAVVFGIFVMAEEGARTRARRRRSYGDVVAHEWELSGG